MLCAPEHQPSFGGGHDAVESDAKQGGGKQRAPDRDHVFGEHRLQQQYADPGRIAEPFANDRADLLLINLGMVDQFVADNPDKVERAFFILTDWKVGVGVNKEQKELERAIADGLSAVRADGTEQKIYDKYKFEKPLQMPIETLTQ